MAHMCGCGGECGDGPCPRGDQTGLPVEDQLAVVRRLARERGLLAAAAMLGT